MHGMFDSGFFGPDSIRPFDREMVERDFKANKFKTKDLTAAIEQALDPTEFDKEMKELREAQRKVDEQERKEMAKSKKRAPAKKEPSPAKKAPVPKSKPAPEPKAKATPAAKQTKVTEQPTTNIPAQIIAPTTTSRKRRGTQTHQDQPEPADNPRDTKRSVSCCTWCWCVKKQFLPNSHGCTIRAAYHRAYCYYCCYYW